MGEFTRDWKYNEESASLPLTSPPLSPDTDNWGREGGWVRVPIPAKITKVESQASELHGRAPWWGWTPLQPSAKPPPRAQVSPHPNQTWCLDTPPQLGRYREGRVLVSSPTPFLGLLNSFPFKSSIFLFFWGGGYFVFVSLAFLSVSTTFPVSFSLFLCSSFTLDFSVSIRASSPLPSLPRPLIPRSFRYAKPILGRVHLTRTKQKAHNKNVSEKNKKF